MPLFEIAIVKKPTKKEAEEGTASEELIYWGEKPIIAKDKESAGLMVMRSKDIPEFDLNRVDLLIRPFA